MCVNARENTRGSDTFSHTVNGDINYMTIALKTHTHTERTREWQRLYPNHVWSEREKKRQRKNSSASHATRSM